MRPTTYIHPLFALALAVALTAVGCEAQESGPGEPAATASEAGARAPGARAAGGTAAGVPATARAARQEALLGQGARIELGQTLGDPDAPIQVVEFSDFGCPYCARFARTTLPQIRDDYIDRGIVHWRYVPVVFGFPGGETMGAAAVCAAEQGGAEAFWKAHDLLYTRQTALRGEDTRARLLEWLPEIGIDGAELEQCLQNPATRGLLVTHTQASQEWYVRGTPTFVVNGVPMSGAMPYEFFQKVFATVLDPAGL